MFERKAFKNGYHIDAAAMLKSLRRNSTNDVSTYGFAFDGDHDPLVLLFLRLLLQGEAPRCLKVGGEIARAQLSGAGLADSIVGSLIHKAMGERRFQLEEDSKAKKAREASPPGSNVAPCDAWAALQVVRVLDWLVRIFAADVSLSGADAVALLARSTPALDLATACVPLALTGPSAPPSPLKATSATPVAPPVGGGRGKKQTAAAGTHNAEPD